MLNNFYARRFVFERLEPRLLYSTAPESGNYSGGRCAEKDTDAIDETGTALAEPDESPDTELRIINCNQIRKYSRAEVSVPLDEIMVIDIDDGEIVTATLTLASPGYGVLFSAAGGSYDSVTGVWSITDTVSGVNNALDGLTFQPNAETAQDTFVIVAIAWGGGGRKMAGSGIIHLQVL